MPSKVRKFRKKNQDKALIKEFAMSMAQLAFDIYADKTKSARVGKTGQSNAVQETRT